MIKCAWITTQDCSHPPKDNMAINWDKCTLCIEAMKVVELRRMNANAKKFC